MADRVCIFIDGSNFYNTLIRKPEYEGQTVDLRKLPQLLCKKHRCLVRTYYYTAFYKQEDNPDLYQKQQSFFAYLRRIPYLQLRLGRKEKRPIELNYYDRKDFRNLLSPSMTVIINRLDKDFGLGLPSQETRQDIDTALLELFDDEFLDVLANIVNKKSPKIVEKGVDVKLATDMICLAYENVYDVAILVAADGDYVEAIEAVKRKGKHVENAFFEDAPNRALTEACDLPIVITHEFLKNCLRTKKKKSNRKE